MTTTNDQPSETPEQRRLREAREALMAAETRQRDHEWSLATSFKAMTWATFTLAMLLVFLPTCGGCSCSPSIASSAARWLDRQ